MAAPLPSGFGLQALPTAPVADPRLFAADPMGALATAQAGLHLGQELANLENVRAQREYESAHIKFLKAQNDLQLAQVAHAQEHLPETLGAKLAQDIAAGKVAAAAGANADAQLAAGLPTAAAGAAVGAANAAAATSANVLAGEQAKADVKLPAAVVAVDAAHAKNALAGATADLDFSKMPTPVKTQLLEASKTFGSWGVPSGNPSTDSTGFVPPQFRDSREVKEVDPKTGNTVQRLEVYDKRNGATISSGEPRIVALGRDEKSVTQAVKEVTSLMQTRDMAFQLEKQLEAYSKAGSGGIGQAIATNAANQGTTGVMSVVQKALGAMAQTKATVQVSSDIANLKNTIANSLFGSALTKEESAALEGMLPTAADLADPERAREKLKGTIRQLDTKLKSYQQRGVVDKAGFSNEAAPAKEIRVPDQAAAPASALSDLQTGKTVRYRGQLYKLGTDSNGKPALVPFQ